MSYDPVGGGGLTNINVSVAGVSNNLSNIVFSNFNNFTFGMVGSTITASYTVPTIPAQSVQPVAISVSNGSFAFSTVTFGNLNGLSFYSSNGSVVGSYTVPVQSVAASASNGSSAFSTISFGNLNGLTFYYSNGSIVGSYTVPAGGNFSGGVSNVGNTGGSTGMTGTRLVFVGSNNVTLSQTTDANGATIGINAPAGGAGATLSYFKNFDGLYGTQPGTIRGASHLVQPFMLPYAASFNYICYPVSRSIVSTTAATASSAATRAGTWAAWETHNIVLYSRGVGASSNSLQSIFSTSVGTTRQVVWTIGAEASSTQASSVYQMSWCQFGADTNTAFSTSESTNSYRMHSSHFSNFVGRKMDCIMFPTSLTAGQYWIAYCMSTTHGGTNTSGNQSNATMTHDKCMISQVNVAFDMMGSTTNSSNQFMQGLGQWTTDSTARTTASMALSQISSTASQLVWPLQFMRIA